MDLEFTGSIPVEAALTESTASKLSCFCDLHGLLIRTWESLVFRVLRAHEIAGSNPVVLTHTIRCGQMVRRRPVKPKIGGSIPPTGALRERKGKPTGDGTPLEPGRASRP